MTSALLPGAVLVTGASSGLGLAVATHLAANGLNVYASVRDAAGREQLESASAKLRVPISIVSFDITDARSVHAAVESIAVKAGAISTLVNNAGIALSGCFEDCDDAQVRHVFETNVFGTMAVTRAVLPHMRKAGRGRIVIITSVAGLLGCFGTAAYCASKFALEGFGESLAQEMAPLGIHVSLIEPGMIRTPVWTTKLRHGQRARSEASPYAAGFRASETLAAKMVDSSPTTPAHVADAVLASLRSRRPPLRTIVGRRARTLFALRRCLPAAFFDRQYIRTSVRLIANAAREPRV